MSTIVFVSGDLVFASRLAGVAQNLAANLQTAGTAARMVELIAAQPPAVVLVDLTAPGLEIDKLIAQVRAATAGPPAVIAFGPHVHEARLEAARAAGCSLVLSRGQFNSQMETLLARYL